MVCDHCKEEIAVGEEISCGWQDGEVKMEWCYCKRCNGKVFKGVPSNHKQIKGE